MASQKALKAVFMSERHDLIERIETLTDDFREIASKDSVTIMKACLGDALRTIGTELKSSLMDLGELELQRQREEVLFLLAENALKSHSQNPARSAPTPRLAKPEPKPAAPTPQTAPEPREPVAYDPEALQASMRDTVGQSGQSGVLLPACHQWVKRVEAFVYDDVEQPGPNDAATFLELVTDLGEHSAGLSNDLRNKALLALIARARDLQERNPSLAQSYGAIAQGFSKVSTFQKEEGGRGYIYGLSLDHTPESTTWERDAFKAMGEFERRHYGEEHLKMDPGTAAHRVEALLDQELTAEALQNALRDLLAAGMQPNQRICNLLLPHIDALKAPRLRRLRKAVRDQLTQEEAEAVRDQTILDGWEGLDFTHNKHAIVIGGLNRRQMLDRIQEAFGFKDVEHIHLDHLRKVQSVAYNRMGDQDAIIFVMTRFVSHKATNLIWDGYQPDGATVINVDRGFGITSFHRCLNDSAPWLLRAR